MKKILSIALAVMLVVSIIPMGLFTIAATAESSGYYKYTITNNEATITKVNTSISGDIVVPETLGGYRVTAIGSYAFEKCENLKSITVPDSVTWIGQGAFSTCNGLKNITLPFVGTSRTEDGWDETFGYIFEYTFSHNSTGTTFQGGTYYYIPRGLKSVTITDETYITEYAFENCSMLTDITLYDSTICIGDSAFYNCSSLKNITIPDSVIYIGDSAFDGTAYYENGFNWENKVLYINNHLIKAKKTITTCDIKQGTKTVAPAAFSGCTNLVEINFPKSLASIGPYAFYGCSKLKNVLIPNKMTSIGAFTFYNCSSLKNINIPSSIKYIWDSAFYNCSSIKHINLPEGLLSIGVSAFAKCSNLTSVVIPLSITTIGKNSFSGTKIKYVFYSGTFAQRSKIYAELEGNDAILDAIWHFESKDHTYKTTTTKATISKSGSIVKKCTKCGETVKTTLYYPKKIKLSTTKYTYNGKAKKPTVTVYDYKGNKISSSNYTVTYKNNTNVGKATVTVKFKGSKYSGSLSTTFTINPKKTTVSSLTAAKKSLKVKITKQSSQVTGYEIQYSTSKKFTKSTTKTKKVTSYKTTSVTLKSLKAKKTYYVRVRTYKTVNSKKYYSDWSSYKSKKTK